MQDSSPGGGKSAEPRDALNGQEPHLSTLKGLLAKKDSEFWRVLRNATGSATSFESLFSLSRLRLKGIREAVPGRPETARSRIALLSGYTTWPLREIFEHLLEAQGISCDLFVGEFDNYVSEILEADSPLYSFKPNLVILIPSARRCSASGPLVGATSEQRAQVESQVTSVLDLCGRVHGRTSADVILCNFVPPPYFDPGPFRSRSLGADWTFRRYVNLELGLRAPSEVHLCDLEYLAARRGLLASRDDRAWFESKQLGSPEFIADVARDLSHIVTSLKGGPKKVLVLDLDNTLWGGVVGDDGLNGIEVGDTSPRGEAFKAFQRSILALWQRGILLAVCSKNEDGIAREVFERHPEMVLRLEHFAAFKANWNPKSENIKSIASELSLGLDSFVFIDDNPAEIEIVRQFCPTVTTFLLGPDPAQYAATLQDTRLFEPIRVTPEDLDRGRQYQVEALRRSHLAQATDMGSYLRSLEMVAVVSPLDETDLPRATQLVNKSNQFNLTTVRRTEAEVRALTNEPRFACFTVRLSDRFGDHGLISVLFCEIVEQAVRVETWVMSCRVLKRQVEDVVVNELARIARARGCDRLIGVYVPSAKNAMVRELYPSLGFTPTDATSQRSTYSLSMADWSDRHHAIQVQRRTT